MGIDLQPDVDETPAGEPAGGERKRGLDWRMLAPLVVILAIVAVTGVLVSRSGTAKQPLPHNVAQVKKPQFQGATATPALPAPPLALNNYQGRPINIADYHGKAVLVTFLYANCPTLCPVIAGNLHTAQSLMTPAERNHVQMIAVSVDPKGDTPANVARFLHDHRLTGQMQYLIGNLPQLARVWKAWNVGSERDAQHPDEVNHSGLVYGISASGKLTTLYPGNFTPAMIVHDVPGLLAS